MHYKSASERTYQIVIHLIVISVAISAVFPLLYVIGMSLTTKAEMIARNYFVIIPLEPTLEAYKRLLASPVIWNSFVVSTGRAVVGPLLTLLLTTIGAYVLAQRTLPGRGIFLFFILATILFNGGLIPAYIVVVKTGINNTLLALILPGAVAVFNVVLMMNFFRGIPAELEEASQIDGASHLRTLINVYLPISMPSIATLSLFSMVGHWNSWFDGLIYMEAAKQPLATMVQALVANLDLTRINLNPEDIKNLSQRGLRSTQIFLGALPILVVYPFLQKYFVKGMTLGAVKE